MRAFFLASMIAATVSTSPAAADRMPLVVVELFTSQGCSNCPPADALLEKLSQRADVLPLALHVDYWDYIGWADGFALPENTTRQRAYASLTHRETVFTPQIVVGGVDNVDGADPMVLFDRIQDHWSTPSPVSLGVKVAGEALVITVDDNGQGTLSIPMEIELVGYIPSATVSIDHGENAGEEITYTNIVRSWETIGTWNGDGGFMVTVPTPDAEAVAVLVQQVGPGRILSAVKVR